MLKLESQEGCLELKHSAVASKCSNHGRNNKHNNSRNILDDCSQRISDDINIHKVSNREEQQHQHEQRQEQNAEASSIALGYGKGGIECG